MLIRKRTFLLVGLVVVAFIGLWVVLALNCPSAGIAITRGKRDEHRLKNRTEFPEAAAFDLNVTLDALLLPGDDRIRWSTERAARVQGLVIDVAYAGTEAANCFNPCRRDIHILIAKRKDAPKSEPLVRVRRVALFRRRSRRRIREQLSGQSGKLARYALGSSSDYEDHCD
jgi:hypothetical protein